MKFTSLLLVVIIISCSNNKSQNEITKTDTIKSYPDTTQKVNIEEPVDSLSPGKIYSNQRFKDVTVEKTGEHTFRIQGKGQIFEASFNWVVEDGHEELQKGYATTDAGAPEWGKFSFSVNAPKKRENSKLHLILFESSAKDGSRQYELPVFLY